MLPPIAWVLIGVVIGSFLTTVVNNFSHILYTRREKLVDRVEPSIIVES